MPIETLGLKPVDEAQELGLEPVDLVAELGLEPADDAIEAHASMKPVTAPTESSFKPGAPAWESAYAKPEAPKPLVKPADVFSIEESLQAALLPPEVVDAWREHRLRQSGVSVIDAPKDPQTPKLDVDTTIKALGVGKGTAEWIVAVQRAATGAFDFLLTPEGLALGGLGKMAPEAVKPIVGAFVAQMAIQSPRDLVEAYDQYQKGDTEQAKQFFANGVMNAAFAAGLGQAMRPKMGIQKPTMEEVAREATKPAEAIDPSAKPPRSLEMDFDNWVSGQKTSYPKGTQVTDLGPAKGTFTGGARRVRFPDGKEGNIPAEWMSSPGKRETLNQLVSRLGRQKVDELIGEWDDGAKLSPDGKSIISFADPRNQTGKGRASTRDFMNWLSNQPKPEKPSAQTKAEQAELQRELQESGAVEALKVLPPEAKELGLEPVEQAPAVGALPFPKSLPDIGTANEPIKSSEIVRDMSTLVDRPIRVGHMAQGKATVGIFKPGPEVIRLRRANDIPTAAHEMAHALERAQRRSMGGGTDIGRRAWSNAIPADVRTELQALDYDPKARRVFEGFAEFVRHWVTLGDTPTVAPRAHVWFENTFLRHNPELEAGAMAIRAKTQAFKDQGALKRLEAFVRWGGKELPQTLKEKAVAAWRRTMALWNDDIGPLERIEREVMGGKLAYGVASPTRIARMVTQSSGARAKVWANKHMTDFAGNPTGAGLREIFGREGIAGDERSALMYTIAKRAVELHDRGIDPGLELADAQYAIQQLATPARELFAQEITAWNKGALEYLRDAGGISQESFDRIGIQNEVYIPFYRVFDDLVNGGGLPSGGRRIGDTPKAVHKIKGSGRELKDPIISMQDHANQIITVADKIRVGRALVDLMEIKEGLGKYVESIPPDKVPQQFDINRVKQQLEAAGADLSAADLDAILTVYSNSPRTPTGGNIVSFVRDGQRKYFELDPELYRTIQALEFHRIHPVLDIFGKISRGVRLGATGVRAGFTLITNPIRDYATMLAQSEYNPVKATQKWAEHMGRQLAFKDTEIKDIWRATGGEISQPLGLDRATMRLAIDDVLANSGTRKALRIIKHPVEFARIVMGFTEAAPRLAEFELALREAGWTPGSRVTPDMAVIAANRAAEVTVNFRRAGAWGRQFNQMVAFFNPAVQGLSKFVHSHKEHPVRSLSRGAGIITIPALANWWMNRNDPEWKNLPDWLRYGFLNFKIGGEWVRFPTPFEWWYAYGALPMAVAQQYYDKRPQQMEAMFGQAMRAITPPIVPSAVAPMAEVWANESLFTGNPIVPASQQKLVPQEQVKPYTTATARQVAQILSSGGVEVSPIQVDHILSGYSGGFLTDMIEASESLAGVYPGRETGEPADLPIVGRLFIRDTAGSQIDEFYTELEHLEAKYATWRKYLAEGNPRAGKYAMSGKESGQLQSLRRVGREMTKYREAFNQATTREQRQKIWNEMVGLAKTAMEIE